jgi:predicted dehydrogenase
LASWAGSQESRTDEHEIAPRRIVGGGNSNTHLPGLRAQAGVEIVGVANRSPESSRLAANELGIARAYGNWQELVAAPEIDAVVIGTWPNLHCDVTCAALAAGKHVLTEARMARSLHEAERMLAAAQATGARRADRAQPAGTGMRRGRRETDRRRVPR